MPSGAKRRKAAKKKKEKITNPITEEHGNGGDSSKSQDEKDSDSGSVSSPTTSQDHHNPLRTDDFEYEQEKEEKEEKSDQPHVEKPDLGEVEVTKEVDFESRAVYIEPWKESNVEIVKDGGGGGSSDGGVEVVEKKKIEIEPKDGVKDVVETGEELEKEVGDVEVVQVVEVNVSGDVEAVDREEEKVVLPQSNGRGVQDNNGGGGRAVESRIPPNSDNQVKDVAPVQPVVRPASWKSCCGLFDVITGSR